MNQAFKITAIDRIQAAEQQHYVVLQKYAQAVRSMMPAEELDRLKTQLCNAFTELQAAHAALDCDE